MGKLVIKETHVSERFTDFVLTLTTQSYNVGETIGSGNKLVVKGLKLKTGNYTMSIVLYSPYKNYSLELGTSLIDGDTDTVTFDDLGKGITIPMSWCNDCINSLMFRANIFLNITNSSGKVIDHTYLSEFFMYIPTNDVRPTIDPSDIIIRNLSDEEGIYPERDLCNITVAPTLKYGAKLKEVRMRIQNTFEYVSVNGVFTNIKMPRQYALKSSSFSNKDQIIWGLTFIITDSRGATLVEQGNSIMYSSGNWYGYDIQKPIITGLNVSRCNMYGAPDDKGPIVAVDCSVKMSLSKRTPTTLNYLYANLYCRKKTSSGETPWGNPIYTFTHSKSYSYSAIDYENYEVIYRTPSLSDLFEAYEFKLDIYDTLTGEHDIRITSISPQEILLNFGNSGSTIGVGSNVKMRSEDLTKEAYRTFNLGYNLCGPIGQIYPFLPNDTVFLDTTKPTYDVSCGTFCLNYTYTYPNVSSVDASGALIPFWKQTNGQFKHTDGFVEIKPIGMDVGPLSSLTTQWVTMLIRCTYITTGTHINEHGSSFYAKDVYERVYSFIVSAPGSGTAIDEYRSVSGVRKSPWKLVENIR